MTNGRFIKILLVLLTGLLSSLAIFIGFKQSPVAIQSEQIILINQPNIIPLERQTSTPHALTDNKPPRQVASIKTDQAINVNTNLINEKAKDLSFLDVYHMYRQWRTCRHFDNMIRAGVVFDARIELENKSQYSNNKLKKLPSDAQIAALHNHAINCVRTYQKAQKMNLPDAGLAPGSSLSEPYFTSKRFLRHLRHLKPDSKQELAIAIVLKQSHQWHEAFNNVLKILAGNDSQQPGLIATLEHELKELRVQQHAIIRKHSNKNPNEPNPDLFKVFMQIEQKEIEIKKLKAVDESELKVALDAFTTINDILFAQLSSPDPNVFFEAHVTLERSKNLTDYEFNIKTNELREVIRPFYEYVPPEEVLLQSLGLKEPIWMRSLIPYAIQLYACELGADCGPDSEWIKNHCFNGFMNLNSASCDMDLHSYYQRHLLSPNQWHDVQLILMAIRGLYEA